MITTFGLLLQRCGLSHTGAADFLGARFDTVKAWASGKRNAPPGVIAEMRVLYAKISRAADEGVAAIAQAKPDTIELGIAADAHEAKQLGWPSVGVHEAVLGLVAARIDAEVVIVPRGATTASAGAADTHDDTLIPVYRTTPLE